MNPEPVYSKVTEEPSVVDGDSGIKAKALSTDAVGSELAILNLNCKDSGTTLVSVASFAGPHLGFKFHLENTY